MSKLIRQKNAHREQQRNFLPNILLLDIDFLQNLVSSERNCVIRSDQHPLLAVVRYLKGHAWDSPAVGIKKGQLVSTKIVKNDGGNEIYL